MDKLRHELRKLPLYLQQPSEELIFNILHKKYITSIVLMFLILEWVARYYLAVYEYDKDPNPDSGRDEDKLERFEDILNMINWDLKIPFLKWNEESILGKIITFYWLDDELCWEIKNYFSKYRNKLGHGIFESVATEIYQDERFSVIMGVWDKTYHTTLRKDTLLWWYNEELYIPIFEWLQQLLIKFIQAMSK